VNYIALMYLTICHKNIACEVFFNQEKNIYFIKKINVNVGILNFIPITKMFVYLFLKNLHKIPNDLFFVCFAVCNR
jgi:hypothetical protein